MLVYPVYNEFNSLPQYPDLTTLKKWQFENIVGKGENAGSQHFLLFSQQFLCSQGQKKNHHLSNITFVVYRRFNLVKVKILSFGKELIT